MKSVIAFTFVWGVFAVGVALGVTFCVVVGAALGAAINHAPLSGGLCGVVWYLVGYHHTIDGITASNNQRVAALAARL